MPTLNDSLKYIQYFLSTGNATLDCQKAINYSTLISVILLDIVTIVCNIIALVTGFIIIKCIITKAIFHIHLQILFVNISFALTLRAISTIFRTISNLYFVSILQINKTNCDTLWSLHSCTVLESLCSLPFEVLSYAYTAIIIERIVAFNLSETYEKRQNVFVVVILAGITWLKPVLDFIGKIQPDTDDDQIILYCSSITTYATEYSSQFSPWELLYVLLIFLCLFFSPILLILGRRKKRKFNSRSSHSLSNRFQILENIRISKIVLQNVLLYSICQLLSIVATYAIMHSKTLEPESIITAKELASFTFIIYTYGFLVFFVFTVPAVAKRFGLCRGYTNPRISSLGTTEDYFNLYTKDWK